MIFNRSRISAAVFTLVASASSFADATTPFSRLITLGDSLTDGGAYTGTVIAGSGGTAPAINYKFTTNFIDGSGKVWAEYLADKMGLQLKPNLVNSYIGAPTYWSFTNSGGTNFAQGGTQVATDPAGETNAALGISAISVKQQVTNLLAQSPTLSSNDLVILWAGANDIFQAMGTVQASGGSTASVQTAAAQISKAASDLVVEVDRLKAAGAKFIVVNSLPNVGQTPGMIAGGDGTVALAKSLSIDVFNATLKASLTGKNVIYVDAAKLNNDVFNNPAKYGFTAVNGATVAYSDNVIPGSTCGTSSLGCIVPTQLKSVANSYLFADGVHPTDAAHAIFGQAAFSALQAVGQQTAMVFSPSYAIRQHGTDLEPRLSPSALLQQDGLVRELRPLGNNQFWYGGSVGSFRNEASQVAPSLSARTQVGSVGIDRMVASNALIGAAASYSAGQSKFSSGSDYTNQLTLGTLYGTAFLSEKIYVNATLQYGDLSFDDIQRKVVLGPTSITSTGKTGGNYSAARIGIGYILPQERWTLSPALALTSAKTTMNSYTESYTPVSVAYGDASYKSTMMTISLSGKMHGEKDQWIPAFRVAADKDLSGSPMTIGIGSDASLISTLSVDKPMREFYSLSIGAQRVTDSGTWLIGGTASAGSALSTVGYSISIGYKIPL